MSIYQNSYFIIPNKRENELFEGKNLNNFLNDSFFEDDFFWKEELYNFNRIENYISNFLEVGKSWSENLKIYGNNDENCLKILIKENIIESVSFRVHFKRDFYSFSKVMVEFCEKFDFLIVDNELNIISLDDKVLVKNITNSRAFRRYRDFFNI